VRHDAQHLGAGREAFDDHDADVVLRVVHEQLRMVTVVLRRAAGRARRPVLYKILYSR